MSRFEPYDEDSPDPFVRLKINPPSFDDPRRFHKFRINDLRVMIITETVASDDEIIDEYKPKSARGSKKKKERQSYSSDDQVTCVLAVGAGWADDPPKYPGMAHLVEHLFCREEADQDPTKTYFRRWQNLGYYLLDNASTKEDTTSYYCNVYYNSDVTTKLQRFLGRFSSVDFSDTAIRSEVINISQEAEVKWRGKPQMRFEEVSRFWHSSSRSLRNYCFGNFASLRGPPPENVAREEISSSWIERDRTWDLTQIKEQIKAFTQKHYKLSNCVLVLHGHGTVTFDELQQLAKNIWNVMTIMYTPEEPQPGPGPGIGSRKGNRKRRTDSSLGPEGGEPARKLTKTEAAPIPQQHTEEGTCQSTDPSVEWKEFHKIYYVQPPEYLDWIYMNWIVDYKQDEEKYSRVKPLEYVKSLLMCCKSQTLVNFLRQSGFIHSIDVRISKTCILNDFNVAWSRRYKAHVFTIILSLTQKGIKERDTVIAAVMCYMRKLKPDQTTYETLSELRNMKHEVMGVYVDQLQGARHLAYAALYPEAHNDNMLTDYEILDGFDKVEIQRVLDILKSPHNLNVVIMARLGEDAGQFGNLPLPQAFNAPNQPLGFAIGSKAISEEQLKKWGDDSCVEHTGVKSLRMPKPNQSSIGILTKDPVWIRLCARMGEVIVRPGRTHPQYPLHRDRNYGGPSRKLYVRVVEFNRPLSKIRIQILPPKRRLSPKLRAYMYLFAQMMRVRVKLIEQTVAEAECCEFEVGVEDFGCLTARIFGLHHMAKKLLVLLLRWVRTPRCAIEEIGSIVFESAQKRLLTSIHDPEVLATDLLMRGTVTGHAPLIESYNFLIEAAQNPASLYEDLASFITQMKITAYVRTNKAGDFAEAINELRQLPPYREAPPVVGEELVADYYKVTSMENESPPGIHMNNPNRGSHLSVVQYTHPFKIPQPPPQDWKATLRFIGALAQHVAMGELRQREGLSYTPDVSIKTSPDPTKPQLTITVASDSRWFPCEEITWRMTIVGEQVRWFLSEEISANLLQRMGWSVDLPAVTALCGRVFDTWADDYRRYVVQIEGYRELSMVPQMNNGPAPINYADLMPQRIAVADGFTDHQGQLTYLHAANSGDALERGRDLSLDVPPRTY